MAGNKKRKAPSQALRAAQLQSTYVPLKRTRSDALSSLEASKLDAALSNDASYGWTLTSNLKIIQKHEFFNIVLNRRDKAEFSNGKQYYSSRHKDQNSAEKAAFKFRYSYEARTGKLKVDGWLDLNQRLLGGDFNINLPAEVNPKKARTAVNTSGARKKSLEMTSAITFVDSDHIRSRNPNNPSNDMTIEEFLGRQATKIQKCLKGRALRRAAEAMRRLVTNQA